MVNGKRSFCGMNSDVLFSERNFLENKNLLFSIKHFFFTIDKLNITFI